MPARRSFNGWLNSGFKRLCAMLFAALLAPPAHAQFSNVRLYGNLNLDFELVNGRQPDGTNPTVNRISSNSSRFGIRGVEYLGAGNAAIFQIESNIQGDTGNPSSTGLASRETYVGLAGRLGNIQGRQVPDTVRRYADDLRQYTDADDVDPIDGGDLGAGSAAKGTGRLRRAARQLFALRDGESWWSGR